MEKKFKFSDNPTVAKTVYGAVIALLCITAIIVGIVAANNRKNDNIIQNPPITDGDGSGDGSTNENPSQNGNTEEKTSFISPVVGSVITEYSMTVPVFSTTLEEWRLHTGIDISTPENADVYAAADGKISAVFYDAMFGNTIEITHASGVKTVYSNLASENLPKVDEEVKQGEKIATIGDSSISELAEEPHLHFELLVDGVYKNPLDYISEEAKKASLGIDSNADA